MLGPFLHPVACCCWNRSNFKAPCKRTQNCNCWPTAPNIVGCYMLGPFAHRVACCCVLLRVVVQCCIRLPNIVVCVCVCVCGGGVIFQLSKASKKWLSCSSRPKKGFALGVAAYRKWHPLCLANYKWGLAGSGYRCCSWDDGCGRNIGLSKHKQLGLLFFKFKPQFNVG